MTTVLEDITLKDWVKLQRACLIGIGILVGRTITEIQTHTLSEVVTESSPIFILGSFWYIAQQRINLLYEKAKDQLYDWSSQQFWKERLEKVEELNPWAGQKSQSQHQTHD